MSVQSPILPGPNAAGTDCCPCSGNPCNCEAPCTLQCRSVSASGSGSFCGFPEFGTPSSPPKYYHNKIFTGGFGGKIGTDDRGCGYLTSCTWQSVIGGQNVIDPVTCVQTNGGSVTNTGMGSGCSGCDNSLTGFADITLASPFTCSYFGGLTLNENSTSMSWTASGVCFTDGSGFVGSLITQASAQETLQNQDSDSQALARAVGGTPVYGPAGGCSPSTGSSTSLTQDAHGPNFTFDATFSQVRAVITNLAVGQNYTVLIDIGARAIGSSGPFIEYTQLGLSFEAESGSETTDWQQLPNISGLQLMPIGCKVSVVGA